MYTAYWLMFLSIFLMADSALALVFGRRYMLWGLNCAPGFYRAFIEKLSQLPPTTLMAVKLAELVIGAILFLIARN